MAVEVDVADFGQLELRIDHLLNERLGLIAENRSLRQQLVKTTNDRAVLTDKNKRAAVKIKGILAHLKEEA